MPAQASSHPGKAPRIAILGGGYAALTAAITLSKQAPESRITLIAPRKAYLKLTHLHETLRYSIRRLCVSYAVLAKRFGFRFLQTKLIYGPESLPRWQQRRTLRLENEEIPFDYLILATGAKHIAPEKTERVLTVDDFCLNRGQAVIQELGGRGGADISVVGGGATGVQFLFELSHYLKRQPGRSCKLRLVNYESRVLGQFPRRFHDHVAGRLREEGIDYLPGTAFKRQEDDSIVLSHRETGEEFHLPSHLSLLFLGMKPNPFLIETNGFGQAVAGREHPLRPSRHAEGENRRRECVAPMQGRACNAAL
ncbi:NADH dehydrogenase [Gammaproteobacteria bacterium]|nr:NADH dehydrogenase [Gammaproteobacteria bacterium]